MATSLTHDARPEESAQRTGEPGSDPVVTRAEWLWTLFGMALLGAFLSLAVDDSPLRSLVAVR